MDLIIWPRVKRHTRLCMQRVKWRWGNKYIYTPRRDLVTRLSNELGLTPDQVRDRIKQESDYVKKYEQYYTP